MPVHSYVVIVSFTVLGMSLFIQARLVRRAGGELRGKPSIEPFFFYSGKLTLFISLFLFLLKAIIPGLGYIYVPSFISWSATVVLCAATLFLVAAFRSMGTSLSMGLPQKSMQLRTTGVYGFSRNPLYTGIHVIAIASCFYFPDLINIAFALYGIIIHHNIIKGEEHFLSEKYGHEWSEYADRVRRYF